MGTTAAGPVHLLELCDQKLMEFVCNVDNKHLVWLEEIEEEAKRMFTREFSKEPELMPKTPSQKNRRRKKRISYVQDENRDPVRKRLSRRKSASREDKVEQLAAGAGENGAVMRRVTRAAAAAAAAAIVASASPIPGSPTLLTRMPKIVPRVEIGASERHRAEQHVGQLVSDRAPPGPGPASHVIVLSDEESTPQKSEAGRLESVAVSSLMATPQDPKGRGVNAGRSASKLRIARTSPASPWQERVLAPILPDNLSTPKEARGDRRSVRRSLMAPSSPGPQNSLAQKLSLVDQPRSAVRRSTRLAQNAAKEPAASARIICHSYLERLLNVEVPQKVSPEEDPSKEAEPMVPKTVTSTPGSQPAAGGQDTPSGGQRGQDPPDSGPRGAPQSARRKRSYKQAVSEPDEEQQLDEEELQPPQSKTPSPPCPASKAVRPLRTFLHTVQRNQMLMTPASCLPQQPQHSPARVDPKEKERQRLEQLRRKEEAEQLRRQKVEEARRQRLEEVKLKREERLRKVLQARERVELMKEEKKKQIEQKFAQLDEKTEKAKEERLAEEKAKKKAAAKKLEEMEARRKQQEEEARRLRRLQQEEEEERRHQELLQKKKKEEEEEQERLRKAAEAKRLAEQREQERRREQERLQAEREQQEREKALRLQRERLQRELEEKKKKEEQQRVQEEQEKKAREAAAASKSLNTTVDVQSPACTSYQMTPQGHRAPPKINPDNYGMDLNSDDSTDDESHPRKPIPSWARGAQLSQAILHQYYHPPSLLELFGAIRPLDPLEDIFKKSKPATTSAPAPPSGTRRPCRAPGSPAAWPAA
ncbi:LOW QUALITY PROTEIN: hypothetical protein QTO34_003228 [Cnephaeus nilssonii]|uniref:Inner centromere protein n=1 Tax=Cnephaeus nilssonii TaxID=3371016 RepID=A0AA40HRF6_CNENI|nr:LOW QUALITY PROTEIN: hypothetical protein QTO34_003228 [Eptesicus nilssonii]